MILTYFFFYSITVLNARFLMEYSYSVVFTSSSTVTDITLLFSTFSAILRYCILVSTLPILIWSIHPYLFSSILLQSCVLILYFTNCTTLLWFSTLLYLLPSSLLHSILCYSSLVYLILLYSTLLNTTLLYFTYCPLLFLILFYSTVLHLTC